MTVDLQSLSLAYIDVAPYEDLLNDYLVMHWGRGYPLRGNGYTSRFITRITSTPTEPCHVELVEINRSDLISIGIRWDTIQEPLVRPVVVKSRTENGNTFSPFPSESLRHLAPDPDALPEFPLVKLTNKREKLIRSRSRQPTGALASFANSNTPIDVRSEISMLRNPDELPIHEDVLSALGNTRLPVWKLTNIYRGNNGSVNVKQAVATPQQILKGGYLFAFKQRVMATNLMTAERREISMLCLGIYENLDRTIQYKRSRAFWAGLVRDLVAGEALRYEDEAAWRAKKIERFKDLARFWDNSKLLEGITGSVEFKDNAPQEEKIDDTIFTAIELQESANNLPEVQAYKDVAERHSKQTQKLNEISGRISQTETLSARVRSDIEYYETVMKRLVKDKELHQVTIEELQEQRQAAETAVKVLDDAKANLEKARDEAFQTHISNANEDQVSNFVENIERSMGVEIYDIVYYVNNSRAVSLKDDSSVSSDPEAWLQSVLFATKEPYEIKVDAGRKSSVAGGPWVVRLSKESRHSTVKLTVRPRDNASVFGTKTGCYKPHPHTSWFNLRTEDMLSFNASISNFAEGCKGEIEPPLHYAFVNNQPKAAIMAAITWLRNANSADVWGKDYCNFPLWSEISKHMEAFEQLNEKVEKPKEVTIQDLVQSSEGMDQILGELVVDEEPAETETIDLEAIRTFSPAENQEAGVVLEDILGNLNANADVAENLEYPRHPDPNGEPTTGTPPATPNGYIPYGYIALNWEEE